MDNVDNLILEHLRAIRSDIGLLKDDTREIKTRLTRVEQGIAGLRRDSASQYGDIVDTHSRYDRLTERIEKIEKRLEITDDN